VKLKACPLAEPERPRSQGFAMNLQELKIVAPPVRSSKLVGKAIQSTQAEVPVPQQCEAT
jgi:hypothetical protein